MIGNKKHLFLTTFAGILSIIVLTMPHTSVSSQRAFDGERPAFRIGRPWARQKGSPELISTSAANLFPINGVKWTTDFSSSEYANSVAVQPDGKIVAIGTAVVVGGDTNYPGGASSHLGYDFAVVRYNANGSLDTTFDSDGKVTASFGSVFGSDETANAVAIQPDGKIIAAGSVNSHFALVRFNPNGSFDPSFGIGGKVSTQTVLGGIREVAVQADGKILAVGDDVVRYNGDGSLDSSFGTGGIIQFWTDAAANAIAVQANGSIVIAGSVVQCVDNGDFEPQTCYDTVLLVRHHADGSPDTSFNGGGGLGVATAVAVQADGKIVTAIGGNAFSLSRYNQDGSLDHTFDGDGTASISISNDGYANTVVIQPDRKIVVSGSVGETSRDFALARLNPDGSLDTTFDGDGKLMTDFGRSETANAVVIQADGKIVAAGYSTQDGYDSNSDFALSRYNTDGSLDGNFHFDGKVATSLLDISSAVKAIVDGFGFPSFLVGYANNGVNDDFAVCRDGDGEGFVAKMITPIGNLDDRANAAAVGPNGKVVAVGYSDNGSNSDFALVRYFPYAAIDTAFGVNGKVTTDFGGGDEATAVAVQADYKILVVGQTSTGGGAALVLARYHDNGILDASFGTGGRIIVPAIQNPRAMVIQSDGRIIAAGKASHPDSPFGDNFALVRFVQDGTLDTTFDTDGIAVIRFDSASQINAIALQSNGKIVAAGLGRNNAGTASDFALARLHPNGSLDSSFGADGKVTTTFAGRSEAYAVRPQFNGKIVAVGVNLNNVTDRDFALARYNVDGSIDSAFNTGGTLTTDFFGQEDDAFATRIRHDGFIITAGSSRRGAKFDFAKAGYWGDLTSLVSISGRALTPGGLGLRNAVVTMIDLEGNTRSVLTSTLGYYSFTDIPAGQNITITVSSRRYRFEPITRAIDQSLSNIDLVALE